MRTVDTTADTITGASMSTPTTTPRLLKADGGNSTQFVLMAPTETTMASRTNGTKSMAISTTDTTTHEETTPSKPTIKTTTGTTADDSSE